MAVAPMVATLSSIGRAIQRYYHRSTTKVVARPARQGPTTSESTKKVAARTAEAMTPGTVPMHSIEDEASVEVRLRAMLLALEERGSLTRVEYLEALRRVLGER
jgi:hypothetical protein